MSDLLLAEQEWWDRERSRFNTEHVVCDERDLLVYRTQLKVAQAAFKLLQFDFVVSLNEVAPDLAICRNRLMIRQGYDPETITEGYNRFHRLQQIVETTVLANGHLAAHLETYPQSKEPDEGHLHRATKYLHQAAQGIADFYENDLSVLHRQRMEHFLGRPLPANL